MCKVGLGRRDRQVRDHRSNQVNRSLESLRSDIRTGSEIAFSRGNIRSAFRPSARAFITSVHMPSIVAYPNTEDPHGLYIHHLQQIWFPLASCLFAFKNLSMIEQQDFAAYVNPD